MSLAARARLGIVVPVLCVSSVFAACGGDGGEPGNGLPPLIPRSVLFGNPERAAPKLSPDGARLAYLAPQNGVLNVWVRTVGGSDDRPLTADTLRGVWEYLWRPDGKGVLYLQDRDGDENTLLYSVALEGGDAVCLTPFDAVQVQLVAADPRIPDTVLLAINRRDPLVHDIYRLRLSDGSLEAAAEPPGNLRHWFPDRAFRVRGAQISHPDGSYELLVRDDESAPWRSAVTWALEDAMTSRPLEFSADGRSMYLLDSRGANTGRLVRMDLATGATEVLAEDPEADLGDEFGAQVYWHPGTYEPQAVAYLKARREWIALDPAFARDLEHLKQVDDGDLTLIDRSADDRTWLALFEHDRRSSRYYSFDRATRQATLLFLDLPILDTYTLAAMEPVVFPARDGLPIHGYLTFPPGMERRNLPLVVNPHGGPWFRDVWGFLPDAQWLANRGYAVLHVNFRGSTSYGKAFINAADKEWGRKMLWDVLDGARWAAAEGYVDSTRMAIYGGSFGGYQTLCAAAFAPDVFRCGIDVVGPNNLLSFMDSFPPQWESRKARFRKRGGDPETEAELLRERSPYFHADRIRMPMLVAQGANDPRVKQAESDQIVAKLRENGVEVEYLLFPDEGHGFQRPENVETFARAMERFLARHLGGRVEEAPGEEAPPGAR